MKISKIMMVCMILLVILSVGVASAAENATADDLTADDSDNRLSVAIDDEITVNDDEKDNLSYVDVSDGKLKMSNEADVLGEGILNNVLSYSEFPILGNSSNLTDLSVTAVPRSLEPTMDSSSIGDLFEFTITASNNGPNDADGVYVNLTWDPKLKLAHDNALTFHTLWEIGYLASGSSTNLTLVVNVTSPGNLTNVFSIGGLINDTNMSNNVYNISRMSSCAGVDYNVVFDINDTVSIPFSCINATTVTPIINYDKANFTIKDGRINITGLKVGRYCLHVSTVTDTDVYYSTTRIVTVTVTKNSTREDPIEIDNETIWYHSDIVYPGQLDSGCYKFVGVFDGNASNPMFYNATMPYIQFSENTYVDASDATFINMGITIQNQGNITITGLTINATRFVEDSNGLGSDDELIYITGCENITLDGLTIDYTPNFFGGLGFELFGLYIVNDNNFQLLNSTINFTGIADDFEQGALKIYDCHGNNTVSGNTIIANMPILDLDSLLVSSQNTRIESSAVNLINNNFITTVTGRDDSATDPTLKTLMLDQCDGVNIVGNTFDIKDNFSSQGDENYLFGLDVMDSNNVLVQENNIIVFSEEGGNENAGAVYAIRLYGSCEHITIDDNNLSASSIIGPTSGIYVNANNYPLIQNNTIVVLGYANKDPSGLVSGINLKDASAKIYNNDISVDYLIYPPDNEVYIYGIKYEKTSGSCEFDIQNNFILTPGIYAIDVSEAENATLKNNTLISNDYANCPVKGIENYNADLRVDLILSISEMLSPSQHYVGDLMELHLIEVRNSGPNDAYGVNLTVVLDSLLQMRSNTTTAGSYDGHVWNIGYLASGASEKLNITAEICGEGTLTNSFSVLALNNDTDLLNNNVVDNITALPSVDLAVTITADVTEGIIYDYVELNVAVENNGPCNATDVTVTLGLNGLYNINNTVDSGTFDGSSWNIATLNAGCSTSLRIRSITVQLGNITQNVNVDSNEQELNSTNDQDSVVLSVLPEQSFIDIAVNGTEFYVGRQIPITVTVTNNYGNQINETVAFYANGTYEEAFSGIGFSFTPQAAGTYVLEALFNSSEENILSSQSNITINVNRNTPNITVDVDDVDYGSPKIVNVELQSEATGSIQLYIGDTQFDANLVNGKAQVILPASLSAGLHSIVIDYSGDTMFSNASVNYNLTIMKVDSQVSVPGFVFDYGKSASRGINFTGANTVTASVNNDKAIVNVNLDVITISGLDAGTYTLTVTTVPDSNHNAVTETATVTVNRIASTLSVQTESEYYCGSSVSATISVNADGPVTAKLYKDDKLLQSQNVSMINPGVSNPNATGIPHAIGSFSTILMNAGEYNLVVDFLGNDNYLPKSVNTTFSVVKRNTEISLLANDSQYGIENTIIAILKDNDNNAMTNQSISIILGGNNYNVITDSNGQASVPVNLNAGSYYVSAAFNGDDYYSASTANATFTVEKLTPTISVTAGDISYGNAAAVAVSLPADATGNVELTVNGNVYNQSIVNGKASFTVDSLDAGEYNVIANYVGNENYLPAQSSSKFKVSKVDSSITIQNIEFNYGSSGSTAVTFSGCSVDQSNILVVGHSEASIAYNPSGKTITVSGLKAGTYTLKVTTTPDKNHNSVSATSSITVKKLNAAVTAEASDITYGEAELISVTLPNDATGSVKLTINNVVYNRDVAAGSAVFNVSGLNVGSYMAMISYPGDGNYLPANATVSFKVNEVPVKTFANLNTLISNIGENGTLKLDDDYVNDGGFSKDGITISKSITIDGNGHVLDANEFSRFFNIKASNVVLKNIVFRNGHASGNGGALLISGKGVKIDNCTFENCSAGSGGSIYWDGSEGVITSSTFINSNARADDGPHSSYKNGDVLSSSGMTNVNAKSNVLGSDADNNGGALYISGNDIQVDKCSFEDCSADYGGSIYWDGSEGVISSSTFINSNAKKGDAVYSNYDVLVVDSKVEGGSSQDAIYGGVIENCTINGNQFVKITPQISVDSKDISYGESETIKVTLPSDATGRVIFSLFDSQSCISNSTATITNGVASYAYSKLGIDIYTVEIVYSGDSKYNQNTATARFTVSPVVKILQNVSIGNDGRISMDLIDDTGRITILIDGEPVTIAVIKDGKIDYTFSTENMTARNHTVTFDYYGNNYDDNVLKHWNGKKYVPREYNMYIAPKVIVIPDKVESDNGIVILELPTNATGTIEVFVDGMKVDVVKVVNGIAEIDLSKYKDGDHVFTFEYSGDDVYDGFSKTMTVEHKIPIISASNKKNVLYTSGKTYTIKVYKYEGVLADKGTSVVIMLNGKKFKTLKTNAKGTVSFKITQNPGTYKVKIDALGVTVTKKLTVKHVVKLNKVSTIKKSKGVTLKATLSKVNGKYLKKQTVTFKINGKKVGSAVTNNKGVAKLTVTSKVLKNLKLKKKTTCQATYKKDTVKFTAKVK